MSDSTYPSQRVCEHCQRAFIPVYPKLLETDKSYQRFCSADCRNIVSAARSAKRHIEKRNARRPAFLTITRECAYCHQSFVPRSIALTPDNKQYQHYCSKECRIDARYEREAARRNTGMFQPQIKYRKDRENIVDFLGGVCVRCGYSDKRALQIDHIDGGGCAESRSMTRQALYRKIYADPTPYQVLCANCNWIKRDENRELSPGRKRMVRPWHTV